MANPYINIYMNSPTAGGTDGTAISTDGTYTDSITIDDAITDSNKVFWVQASAANSEEPITDRSVSLEVQAVIIAV